MSDQKRIENLEWAVRRLTDEVTELRATVGALAPGTARPTPFTSPMEPPAAAPGGVAFGAPTAAPASDGPPSSPPSPAPVAPVPIAAGRGPRRASGAAWGGGHEGHTGAWPVPAADVESLVGRYGALALAALTIMLGIGAFISWAVNHVRLGPEARVALGAVAALGVGALGFRLRARGARSFGNAVLALALALVHLVAWGAGPYLHVVPDGAALAVADAASLALAVLALREREQALFVVGLGGSLIAPYVFSNADGHVVALLGYGFVLRIAGAFAIREHDWTIARRVLGLGGAAYALVALASVTTTGDAGPWLRFAPALYLLACAGVALAVSGARAGRALALGDLVTLLLVLGGLAEHDVLVRWLPAFALAGTALSYVALVRSSATEQRWPPALGLPLAFLALAVAPQRDPTTVGVALVALVWVVVAGSAAWRDLGGARGMHAVVAGTAWLVAAGLASYDHRVFVIAVTAAAVVLGLVVTRTRLMELMAPAIGGLVVASVTAMGALAARPSFAYVPFGTRATLDMAVAVAGWIALALCARRAFGREAGEEADAGTVLAGVAALAAFGWGRQELIGAFSAETATFLLVAWFAVAGVVTLLVGRWKGMALARRVGLGLAIWAALKALLEASDLRGVALRIGSYLLVGAFLLAVAYWYRAAEVGGVADGAEAGQASGG